jgi:hypothetical protein
MTGNLADRPRRIRAADRRRITTVVAALAAVLVPMALTAPSAAAQMPAAQMPAEQMLAAEDEVATGVPPVPPDNYVTTTTAPDKSLDVSAFSPTCIRDVPFINFTIVPKGFSSSGPATLTFFDVNGNFVEQVISPTLSGQIIYPGATVGPNGEGLDWPGWTRAPDGSWIPDPSDAIYRDGLTVLVEVNPTATAKVSYPPSDSVCANPPRTSPPTTTIVCVPGQNNDGTPDDDCALARTGGGVGNTLIIGGAAVAAGLIFLAAARRRRRAVSRS